MNMFPWTLNRSPTRLPDITMRAGRNLARTAFRTCAPRASLSSSFRVSAMRNRPKPAFWQSSASFRFVQPGCAAHPDEEPVRAQEACNVLPPRFRSRGVNQFLPLLFELTSRRRNVLDFELERCLWNGD